MKRQICWIEKLPEQVKLDIRVSLLGGGRVKWQTKRSDADEWDYDTPPTAEQRQTLLTKVDDRYRRRNSTWKDVEAIRRWVAKAE